MNVMRKLRGSGGSTMSSANADPTVISGVSSNHEETGRSIDIFSSLRSDNLETYLITDHDNLTMNDKRSQNYNLQTLKQMFQDYTKSVSPLSEQERNLRLYQMLPLFCKVFY